MNLDNILHHLQTHMDTRLDHLYTYMNTILAHFQIHMDRRFEGVHHRTNQVQSQIDDSPINMSLYLYECIYLVLNVLLF